MRKHSLLIKGQSGRTVQPWQSYVPAESQIMCGSQLQFMQGLETMKTTDIKKNIHII